MLKVIAVEYPEIVMSIVNHVNGHACRGENSNGRTKLKLRIEHGAQDAILNPHNFSVLLSLSVLVKVPVCLCNSPKTTFSANQTLAKEKRLEFISDTNTSEKKGCSEAKHLKLLLSDFTTRLPLPLRYFSHKLPPRRPLLVPVIIKFF